MKNTIKLAIFSAVVIGYITSCTPSTKETNDGQSEFVENPPADGFDEKNSDAIAIKLADDVMTSMGGRNSWDATRFLAWNFFGARKHLWDKQTGDVRIEAPRDSTIILMNINTMTGRVMKKGQEFTSPDSLSKYLERGKSWWINDSYWLFMPFKLKDSGVTLQYVGEDTTMDGRNAHVLSLLFKGVGVTPDNGYKVYVDMEQSLITQWAYYKDAYQDEPNFVLPWVNYKPYGKILLSGDRGQRQITEISVLETVPEGSFTEFSPIIL
ncbi:MULTISPECIES: hypothetical protein [unclassified Imperialibacter]|uniref:hypothetical protein n=1 Tax=unclassified Imperialibacter TaxID=2629706 RepID=UPI00125C67BE|nr:MULTISPECIES: hypothetical protein [unclassified Imperialibacter]CAD5267536.1 conserved hypothetical protein [Imperialibacter sp. 89]CAD5295963.1 conserved hypothetical protein [Imperialibacter sp. 75]VVT33676.1 conserved hypothetical protein [Imperialibacter sp. EC-SDR9]